MSHDREFLARTVTKVVEIDRSLLRVVVYGTGHSLLGESVALTRKHFETPFGKIPCGAGLLRPISAR